MRISINDLKTKFSSWKIPTGADWDNLIDTLAGRGNVEYYKVPNITGDIWRDVNSSTTLDGTFRATILIEYGGSQLYLFTYTQPILYGFTGRMTNQKEYVFYFYAIKGDKGDQGITGDIGADSTVVGPQGMQGPSGGRGEVGAPGPQGIQGPIGLKGNTGERGAKGDTGNTGANSFVPGPKGDQGIQGVKGNQGSTGSTGATGAKGNTGNTGPQGIQGVKGNTGTAGSDSTVPGPTGPKGSKGDQGLQGIQGATGPQGNPGVDTPTNTYLPLTGGTLEEASEGNLLYIKGSLQLTATGAYHGIYINGDAGTWRRFQNGTILDILKFNGTDTAFSVSNGNVSISADIDTSYTLNVGGNAKFTKGIKAGDGTVYAATMQSSSGGRGIKLLDHTGTSLGGLDWSTSQFFLRNTSDDYVFKVTASNKLVQLYGELIGINATFTGLIQSKSLNALGTTTGNYKKLNLEKLISGNSDEMYIRQWAVRKSNGSEWTTVNIREGITINAAYNTPTSSKVWWDRDAQGGRHVFGDGTADNFIIFKDGSIESRGRAGIGGHRDNNYALKVHGDTSVGGSLTTYGNVLYSGTSSRYMQGGNSIIFSLNDLDGASDWDRRIVRLYTGGGTDKQISLYGKIGVGQDPDPNYSLAVSGDAKLKGGTEMSGIVPLLKLEHYYNGGTPSTIYNCIAFGASSESSGKRWLAGNKMLGGGYANDSSFWITRDNYTTTPFFEITNVGQTKISTADLITFDYFNRAMLRVGKTTDGTTTARSSIALDIYEDSGSGASGSLLSAKKDSSDYPITLIENWYENAPMNYGLQVGRYGVGIGGEDLSGYDLNVSGKTKTESIRTGDTAQHIDIKFWKGTQEQYNGLTPDDNTQYIIVD